MNTSKKFKRLRAEARSMQKEKNIKYSQALDIIAEEHLGVASWNKIFTSKKAIKKA